MPYEINFETSHLISENVLTYVKKQDSKCPYSYPY